MSKSNLSVILGIETSCDETAVALVNSEKEILGHLLYTQIEQTSFGGVVPEIASRAHLSHLPKLMESLFLQSGFAYDDLDGIAATCGPGLIGGVLIGALFGKSMANVLNIPFYAINHLEAHALTVRLVEDVSFPFLLLLVSGGHSQLLWVKGVGDYSLLGSTLDDAAGEAFDKVGKLLGLSYPAGPCLEALARLGNPHRFPLPSPLKGRRGCDLSFSGLKTATRLVIESLGSQITSEDKKDIAASFQKSLCDSLVDRTQNAIRLCLEHTPTFPLVISGGVGANQTLKGAFTRLAHTYGLSLHVPPPALCTDNGAMVAWAGQEKLKDNAADMLDFEPRPRWPLSC